MAKINDLTEAQNAWFEDISARYMKHNVSLYYVDDGPLPESVDFYIKITQNLELFQCTMIQLVDNKGEIVYSVVPPSRRSLPSQPSMYFDCITETMNQIKRILVSFLEEHQQIRVAMITDDNSKYELISTYEERGEKSNQMYDSFKNALYYMIRFPKLDYDGYDILSGMAGDFDTFQEKYDMDVTKFPYSLE